MIRKNCIQLFFPRKLVVETLLSHTCCLDRPFALTVSTHRSLLLSSELSLLSRHLGLGCCHLASQESSGPSVDIQRESLFPGENKQSRCQTVTPVNWDDEMTLEGWYRFDGEHPPPNRRQFPAHSCRGGMRQPCFGQSEDVLGEHYTCRFAIFKINHT